MEDFKQELTENSYFRQEELVFRDCDRNKKARIAALLNKVACFAGYDYDARGLTHEKLLAAREVFLLSRVSLHIHDCPQAGDVLTITTWENGVQGAHMQRVYEMADQAGRLRVSAKSDWILVDPLTRKILRPNAFKAKALTTCPKDIDCPQPKKLLLPHEGREELGVRPVVWSDLDGNGHLFSGNYGDIVWDYLPADLQDQTPKEFYINYNKEATLGEELRLVGCRQENEYFVEGLGPNGPCFTTLCVF
jgi:acyl-ACP thioesterase